MTVYVEDADFTLHVGDALETLRTLPSGSVHCALTSPPFFGLRDYQAEGQIGLESTPEEWCARLVEVFREVRRVLRADATLFVEIGDSYDEKSLLGQPFLLAFALRADGWYWRDCIIWARPNPMPESVRDRTTKSHSYVLMFSKQPRYFFDPDAIAEPAEWARWGDQTVPKYEGTDTATGWIKQRTKSELEAKNGDGNGTKNARSVWSIPTEGFPGAHFATWPTALVDRIIRAGTSERGCCPVCGAAWVREQSVEYIPLGNVERQNAESRAMAASDMIHGGPQAMRHGRAEKRVTTLGWCPSCDHDQQPVPCTVLDPFGGSGTTALVARKLGRRSILIELNAEYARMAAERLQQLSLLA